MATGQEKLKKTYRVDRETDRMIQEMKDIYNLDSENELFKVVIKEIYEQKKSKGGLVPYEELKKTDQELQKAIFQVGRMQGLLEKEKEEKERLLQEIEQLKKQINKKRGFWARLFGLTKDKQGKRTEIL